MTKPSALRKGRQFRAVRVAAGLWRPCPLCAQEYLPLDAHKFLCPKCYKEARAAGLNFKARAALVLQTRR